MQKKDFYTLNLQPNYYLKVEIQCKSLNQPNRRRYT